MSAPLHTEHRSDITASTEADHRRAAHLGALGATGLFAAVLCALVTTAWPLSAEAQMRPIRGQEAPNPCGLIYTRHYGPYDYRTERHKIRVVEEFHFTPEVEAGIRGVNTSVAGDVNYTLKASPNHHRALVTLVNVTQRARKDFVPGMEWPMECYFDRAIRYAFDDPVVRMLYAQFLNQRNRKREAEAQLVQAASFAPDNPFTQFNVGLIALEIGNHDLALKQAHMAQAMGFQRRELEAALRAANRWVDPASTSAAPAAAASAPAAEPSNAEAAPATLRP